MAKLSRLLALCLLFLFAFIVEGCAARQQHGTGRDVDLSFLEWMTDHLRDDIRNARACDGKDIRPELKQFCSSLLADQQVEYERMTKMMNAWYQEKPHQDTLPLWIDNQDGEVFERAFIKAVLREHGEAIEKSKECQRSAKRSELRDLCSELSRDRAAEKKKLDRWNCDWFSECK